MDFYINGVFVLCQFIAFGLIYLFIKRSLGAYLSKKGENLATKEDIAEITKLIESEKALVQRIERSDTKKYELKHIACLDALYIVDSHLSKNMTVDNDGNRIQPYITNVTTDVIRDCHNRLILSVDNQELVHTFLEIITGKSLNMIISLEHLRGLIRTELGFVGPAYRNDTITWFAGSTAKVVDKSFTMKY